MKYQHLVIKAHFSAFLVYQIRMHVPGEISSTHSIGSPKAIRLIRVIILHLQHYLMCVSSHPLKQSFSSRLLFVESL